MSWIWACLRRNYSDRCKTGQAVPAKAVCERGRSWQVALPVHGAAVATRAERPEGCGWAWEVQTDVPKRVYRRGNAATGKEKTEISPMTPTDSAALVRKGWWHHLWAQIYTARGWMFVWARWRMGRVCVHALFPSFFKAHLHSIKYCITENLALMTLWGTLAEASCAAINVHYRQTDTISSYQMRKRKWKSSNGRCIYSINKGWWCSKSLSSLQSSIARWRFVYSKKV